MPTAKVQAESHQSTGRSAYSSGNYAEALTHFAAALAQPNLPAALRASILDNLSATKEKLGGEANLADALSHARAMIRLQPASAEGYLRGGKVLQLSGRDGDAVRLYEYGISKLPSDGSGVRRARLGAQIAKVRSRIAARQGAVSCEPQRRDPFAALPLEVAQIVLLHVPFRALMLARGVSRGWKTFIESAPGTFDTLDLREARRSVGGGAFKALARASRGCVRVARLARLKSKCGDLLAYLVARSPGLSVLEVCRSEAYADLALAGAVRDGAIRGLRSLVLDVALDITEVFRILRACVAGGLKEASFESVHVEGSVRGSGLLHENSPLRSLEKLRIDVVESSTLLKAFPNLRILELPGTSIFSEDEHLDFTPLPHLATLHYSQPSRPRYPLLPSSIASLTITETFATYTTPDLLSSPLPSLHSLSFDTSPSLTTETLTTILSPPTPIECLTTLRLEMCPKLDFTAVFAFLRESGLAEHLQTMSVKGNAAFQDELSVEFTAFVGLRSVDVGFTGVSGVGVLNIAVRAGKGGTGGDRDGLGVEWIGIEGCGCVGVDAVERVRGLGVRVFQGRGRGGRRENGRRVRHE
ncbi:unnamed protein product [Tuber aestivum]|uniref:F-box domain-containing protein n=1 Tax=Tuber aestivum TaxID=59557 RepID=A0A292Q8Z1_9PEZI|nr:unnamed protein product [Tuber aestivum]